MASNAKTHDGMTPFQRAKRLQIIYSLDHFRFVWLCLVESLCPRKLSFVKSQMTLGYGLTISNVHLVHEIDPSVHAFER